jgi:hypothetical protein
MALDEAELRELVTAVYDATLEGRPAGDSIERLKNRVDFPQVDTLFLGDHGPDYIVARIKLFRRLRPGDLAEDEVVALIERNRYALGTEAEIDSTDDLLPQLLPHPRLSALLQDFDLSPLDVIRLASHAGENGD